LKGLAFPFRQGCDTREQEGLQLCFVVWCFLADTLRHCKEFAAVAPLNIFKAETPAFLAELTLLCC
jgi:hypothetical protein